MRVFLRERLYDPARAVLELFWNSWSAGLLGTAVRPDVSDGQRVGLADGGAARDGGDQGRRRPPSGRRHEYPLPVGPPPRVGRRL